MHLMKRKILTVINIKNICFYIFWITLMLGKGWGLSSADSSFVRMLVCVIPFLGIKMILTKWNGINELVWCALLNLLGIVVWICSGSADILLTMVAITACKDINLKKIFTLTLWVKGSMFVLRTTLALVGIVENETKTRADRGLDIIRYGLGYGHPNIAHYLFLSIIILALLLYHNKMKVWHYLSLLLYNLYLFSKTNSRTATYMVLLCIISIYLFDKYKAVLYKSILRFVGKYVYILAAGTSFIIVILFTKVEILRSLNTLSSRFSTGYRTVENNKLTLFGLKNINSDLGYITTLYSSGVIVFLLFVVGMTLLMKELIKRHRYIEILFFAILAGYHMMANYNDTITMNQLLLYLAVIIFPRSANYALGEETLGGKEKLIKWKNKIFIIEI